MKRRPRISIVTPSLNQGKYINETIESVQAQGYPDVEHIVVDGGSMDDTSPLLRSYPHLTVLLSRDRGRAAAVNVGLRAASGEIQGVLNTDDRLVTGALHRVADEIDPYRGRHVVVGRCRFVDEEGRFIGIEDASRFESHRRVLEVWKRHMISQPAVFWNSQVPGTCGLIDENVKYAPDYDLFCRFSRKYAFHFVDQVLATKTMRGTEAERLDESIRVSRRYWGSLLSLTYWQLGLSLAWYRLHRTHRGRAFLGSARNAWRASQRVPALGYALAGAALAPDVAFYVGAYPHLRVRAKGTFKKLRDWLAEVRGVHPQTAIYLEQTGMWDDGWAGPLLILPREARLGAGGVTIQGRVHLAYIRRPFVLRVRVDGQDLGEQRVPRDGDFRLSFPLTDSLAAGVHTIEVRANAWFVPDRRLRNRDFRPLSWKVRNVEYV